MRQSVLALVASVALSSVGAAQAQSDPDDPIKRLTIEVHGFGASAEVLSRASFAPETTPPLPEGASFSKDLIAPVWSAETPLPLQFVTRMRIGMKRDAELLRPPAIIEVPYATSTAPVRLPISEISPRLADIQDASESLVKERTEEEWVDLFITTDMYLRTLQQGLDADDVQLTPPLKTALVVYAAAVDRLVKSTDWFGEPELMSERITLLARFSDDPDLNDTSIETGLESLRNVRPLIAGRIFSRAIPLPGIRNCVYLYPISLQFYQHLQKLSAEEYSRLLSVAKFQRDQVLSVATSCFRRLLSTDNFQVFYVEPELKEPVLRGQSAAQAAANLIAWHKFELESYSYAPSPSLRRAERCGSNHYGKGQAQNLYCDLKFLEQIAPRIIPPPEEQAVFSLNRGDEG